MASGQDGYFIVWQDARQQATSGLDVYGQFLDLNGMPTGPPLAVTTAAEDQSQPVVAFNSQRNEYLVVWADYRNGNDEDIYGQVVKADGTLGGSFSLSLANRQGDPKVAYSPHADSYLVVWEDRRPGTSGDDVYGQVISASGSRLGADFLVGGGYRDQAGPTLAYGQQSRTYLVTWHDLCASCSGWDIYGQRVTDSGQLAGASFALATDTAYKSQRYPAVATRPAGQTDEFLVIWENYINAVKQYLYSQRVGADGSLLDEPDTTADESDPTIQLPLADSGVFAGRPVVIYHPRTGLYLTAWHENDGGIYISRYSPVMPASPTAGFTASPDNGTVPLTVTFSDTSTGAIATWTWDFGDGNSLTSAGNAPVSHTYLTAGTFNAVLTATNPGGLDTALSLVTVSEQTRPILSEDFEGFELGLDPPLWLDQKADTVEQDNFEILWVDPSRALGTVSGGSQAVYSHYAVPGWMAWQDYELQGRFQLEADGGLGLTVYSGYPAGQPKRYLLERTAGTSFRLSSSGTTLSGDVELGVTPQPDTWYRFRLQADTEANRTIVRAKIWAEGQPEPASWQAAAEDSSPDRLIAGAVGLQASGMGGKYWDDLRVTPLSSPAPVAGFSGDPLLGPAPLTVTFTNNSTNATAYEWNFGDGATSSATHPTHSYSQAGSFTVTLAAGDGLVTDTLVKSDYVEALASTSADFSAFPLSGLSPLLVQFLNNSNGASSYYWDFGDGGTSAAASPAHTYALPGIYTVSLTAGSGGISDTLTRSNYITATAPVSLSLVRAFAFGATGWTRSTYNEPGTVYAKVVQNGQNFTYSTAQGHGYVDTGDIDTSPNNRGIYSGDDELYDQFIGAKFNGAITFQVDLPHGLYRFVAAGGDAAYDNHVSTVEIQDGQTGPKMTLVSDYRPSARGEFWTVGFEDKEVPPPDRLGADPTFVPQPDSGSLEVTQGYIRIIQRVGHDAPGGVGGDLSLVEIWRVEDGPGSPDQPITGLNAVNDSPTALGQATALTATVTSGTNAAYTWAFGDGSTGSGAVVTHTYPAAGVYPATVTASNPVSLVTNTTVVTITGLEPVVAGFSAAPLSGTTPLTVTFINSSVNATNYFWNFGDGVRSSEVGPSHSYTQAGVYTVTLAAADEFVTDTLTRANYITATPAPTTTSPGGTIWWDEQFFYRRALSISGPLDHTPGVTTVLEASLDTAVLISNDRLRSDGYDLRLLYYDESSAGWRELPRRVTGLNTTTAAVRFPLQGTITATSRSYYLYYGNWVAEEPPLLPSTGAPSNAAIEFGSEESAVVETVIESGESVDQFLVSADGRLQVGFPPEAVGQTLVVTYTPRRFTVRPGANRLAQFDLRASTLAGVPVAQFAAPVRLSLDYRALGVLPELEQTVLLLSQDVAGPAPRWTSLTTTVDPVNKLATATTDRPGLYQGIAAGYPGGPPSIEVAPLSPDDTALFSGASAFAFPILVPPGTAGLQPELKLTYSSRVAQDTLNLPSGIAGWGVDLNLPFIGRAASSAEQIRTPEQVGRDNYFFISGGARSQLIKESGSAFYRLAHDNRWRFERRSGGACSQVATLDCDYWLVTTRDGTRYRFGYRADAIHRSLAIENNSVDVYPGRFRLDQIQDPNGNTITFSYGQRDSFDYIIGNTPYDAAVYLTAIDYTSNDAAALPAKRQVVFSYAPREIDGVRDHADLSDCTTRQCQLLTRRLEAVATQVRGQRVARYLFDYDYLSAGSEPHGVNNRLVLKQVSRFGLTDADSLPAIRFDYHALTGQAQGLLAQIDNGYGAVTAYDYSAGENLLAPPDLHLSLRTVSVGGPDRTTRFGYDGFLADRPGTVVMTRPDQSMVETEFHLDQPKRGRPESVRLFEAGSTAWLQQTSFQYLTSATVVDDPPATFIGMEITNMIPGSHRINPAQFVGMEITELGLNGIFMRG